MYENVIINGMTQKEDDSEEIKKFISAWNAATVEARAQVAAMLKDHAKKQ